MHRAQVFPPATNVWHAQPPSIFLLSLSPRWLLLPEPSAESQGLPRPTFWIGLATFCPLTCLKNPSSKKKKKNPSSRPSSTPPPLRALSGGRAPSTHTCDVTLSSLRQMALLGEEEEEGSLFSSALPTLAPSAVPPRKGQPSGDSRA